MDRLELFMVDYYGLNFDERVSKVIEYHINGKNLLDIFEEVLGNVCFRKNRFVGINSSFVFLPSLHLLGQPIDDDPSENKRTTLYACAVCGSAACEFIEARITLNNDTVVWDDFVSSKFYNKKDKPLQEEIDLSGFKFEFLRADYENDLRYHVSKKLVDVPQQLGQSRLEFLSISVLSCQI